MRTSNSFAQTNLIDCSGSSPVSDLSGFRQCSSTPVRLDLQHSHRPSPPCSTAGADCCPGLGCRPAPAPAPGALAGGRAERAAPEAGAHLAGPGPPAQWRGGEDSTVGVYRRASEPGCSARDACYSPVPGEQVHLVTQPAAAAYGRPAPAAARQCPPDRICPWAALPARTWPRGDADCVAGGRCARRSGKQAPGWWP